MSCVSDSAERVSGKCGSGTQEPGCCRRPGSGRHRPTHHKAGQSRCPRSHAAKGGEGERAAQAERREEGGPQAARRGTQFRLIKELLLSGPAKAEDR